MLLARDWTDLLRNQYFLTGIIGLTTKGWRERRKKSHFKNYWSLNHTDVGNLKPK